MKLGINSAVFLLFFGIALYEAIKLHNWLYAGVFAFLGLVSLFADSLKRK